VKHVKRKSGLTWQSPKRQPSNPVLIILGLALTLPAFGMLWASYIQPLQTMIIWSTQNVNPIRSGDAPSVGGANFQAIFENPALTQSLTFTLLIIGGRVLAVVLIPPLLGWTLSRFGRGLRFVVRLFIALPLVFFAPAITALSWRVALNPVIGLFPNQTAFANPTNAVRTLQLIDFLTSFGIACALGVYTYVVAFRPLGGEGTRRGTRRGFFAVWLTALALAVTTALQSLTFVYALTNGGPANATRALPFFFFQIAYQQFRFGLGAALGLLMLAVVLALGLIVGLYIILSNIGLISLRPMRFRVLGRSVAFLIMAVLFVGSLALVLLNLLPILWVYVTPSRWCSCSSTASFRYLAGRWHNCPVSTWQRWGSGHCVHWGAIVWRCSCRSAHFCS
jgi:ABC-type sugar transport system permease subunit